MREVLRPDSLSQDYASGTAGVTAAPNAQDAVVEGLKSKLRAADLRERELHQHLLFHMKEKELLVDQVAELQRVCEALLLSQMQEAAGPSTAAATAAATAALSAAEQVAHKITARRNDGGARSSEAPPHRQQHNAISSSLKAIMETVSPPPAPASYAALSRSQEHPTPAPTTAGTLTPGALSTALGVAGGTPNVPEGTVGIDGGGFEQHPSLPPPPPAAVQSRTAGSDPAIDIPQLLLERGGRIRITLLWDAYRSRFGDTPYTLKDLFSMVKTGAIPFVVHEPPAGIRLLEEAPVYQQLRHQLQLQRQLGQQRQAAAAAAATAAEAAAQAASGSSYHAQQGAGAASPMMGATDARGAGAGGLNAQQQQQQQQHQRQDAFPPPPVPIASTPPPGPYAGHRTNPGATAATATNAAGANFTSGSAGDWTPPVSSRSPATSNGGNAAADHHDDRGPSAEAEASGVGRAGDEKGEEQEAWGEGEHGGTESQFRFGSYGSGSGSASDGDGAATNDAGAGGTAIEPPESTRKRRVDWKELQRNLNLLLKDEGALNGRDLNHVFQLKFGKSPYLDGTPLRYAVSAGWLNGVCFDVTNNTFNLSVRVPVNRREDAPQGAPAYPPGAQRRASTAARPSTVARSSTAVAHRTGPTPLAPGELDWKQLSREFRQLLSTGALEAKEVHAKYHREYSKPLHIGAGYSMRQAVIDGRLEGITFERGSRRLALV